MAPRRGESRVFGMLRSGTYAEQMEAIRAIAKLPPDYAARGLEVAFGTNSPAVARPAVRHLAFADHPRVTHALCAALSNPVPSLRSLAADFLGRRMDVAAAGPLEQALTDPSPGVAMQVAGALLSLAELSPEPEKMRGMARDAMQRAEARQQAEASWHRFTTIVTADEGRLLDAIRLWFRDGEVSAAEQRLLELSGDATQPARSRITALAALEGLTSGRAQQRFDAAVRAGQPPEGPPPGPRDGWHAAAAEAAEDLAMSSADAATSHRIAQLLTTGSRWLERAMLRAVVWGDQATASTLASVGCARRAFVARALCAGEFPEGFAIALTAIAGWTAQESEVVYFGASVELTEAVEALETALKGMPELLANNDLQQAANLGDIRVEEWLLEASRNFVVTVDMGNVRRLAQAELDRRGA